MKKNRRKAQTRSEVVSEVLETRQLLTGPVDISLSMNRSTRTLTITGTDGADRVSIEQNDAAKGLKITMGRGNAAEIVRQFPSHLVDRIMVQLAGGDDEFQFATIRDVRYARNVQLNLGDGNDDAFVRWADGGAVANANLTLSVVAGAGNDTFGTRIGQTRSNVTTAMAVDLGDGDDRFTAKVLNPSRIRSSLTVTGLGGEGNDEFQYEASGTLGSRAVASVRLEGQAGNDSFEVRNAGRIDGDLTEKLFGDLGDDVVKAEVINVTGAGRYSLTQGGGGGDDSIVADVQISKGAALSAKSAIDGGDGNDHAMSASPTVLSNVETATAVQISGILADIVSKYGIPGITASVVVGDQVLTGAAGVRALGAAPKVQVDDRFGIGSTTKAMTATLAGVLVDQGRIRWDSTISELFPELRSTMQPEYRDVTLEQLLQHRGGIVADEDASEALGELVASYDGPARLARQVLLPDILKERPVVAVGEYSYSNGGYAVAAAMMERATRSHYESLMNRHIFRPLGIKSATFDPQVSNPTNPKQPIGHLPDGTPAPGDRPPLAYLGKFLRPAGADLRMNVSDWSKFVRVHLGQRVNGRHLVRPATLVRLHQAVPLLDAPSGVGYSMGWLVVSAESAGFDSSFGHVLQHNGSDGVWLSEVAAFPDLNFSIQILANSTVDKDGNDLGTAAFAEIRQLLMRRYAPRS